MARPTLPPGDKRTTTGIRLNDREMEYLDAMALHWGCSRNDAAARLARHAPHRRAQC